MLKLEGLNQSQRQAVTHGEGPLLVLAGPGSGKTFTITQRILYLIEVMQVPPEEILVITFTKEAALSMQQRFLEQSTRTYPVNFGTFHSVFYHILRQSNLSKNRQLLTEAQKKNLILPIIKKYHNSNNASEDAGLFLAAISYLKNTGKKDIALGKLSQEFHSFFDAAYKEYESARKSKNAMDFDDMVWECRELLAQNIQLRKYWQARFKHILMDEFQDINPMQYQVIGLLTSPPYHLFAVGDDDQAIYGFRGSAPACLKQFVTDYQAKQLLLNINYRSHAEIIKASSLVIAENQERFEKEQIAGRQEIIKKDLQAASTFPVSIHTFVEREQQYEYMTRMISETKETDTCAALFRTNALMQGFAARLKQQGIAFEMKERVSSIYEHMVVKDILAYLRLAAGENARELWLQILNKPSRFISREAFVEGKGGAALRQLEKQLEVLKRATPFLAVQYVRRVIGYEKYLIEASRKYRNGTERLEEWLEVLDWICEDAKHYKNLEEWQCAQEKYANSLKETRECTCNVHLMTVHASKGLEFDHVWIPDCNEKVFPHGNMLDKETCEEERRIFYVAMTRAKKSLGLLCLTGTKERPRLISRFLNPLWKHYSSSSTTSSNSH